MTTIVNTPRPAEDSSRIMGMMVFLVILFLGAYMFFVYGMPAVRGMMSGPTQIIVPDKVDINVNQTK